MIGPLVHRQITPWYHIYDDLEGCILKYGLCEYTQMEALMKMENMARNNWHLFPNSSTKILNISAA